MQASTRAARLAGVAPATKICGGAIAGIRERGRGGVLLLPRGGGGREEEVGDGGVGRGRPQQRGVEATVRFAGELRDATSPLHKRPRKHQRGAQRFNEEDGGLGWMRG